MFPKASILVPFRSPVQHAYSLLTQHKKFIESSMGDVFISQYMKWIGHTEFGPNYVPIHSKNLQYSDEFDINHWLEQWLMVYSSCLELLNTRKNVHFICYESLCGLPAYWPNILELLDVKKKYDYGFTESSKNVSLIIDDNLNLKASHLYSRLIDS